MLCLYLQDRFITVSLRGGRVHFRVEYGGGARLELMTSQKYNTGELVRIEAARHFDRKKRLERGIDIFLVVFTFSIK